MPSGCKLIYRPGRDAENPADFMRRLPSSSQLDKQNLADYDYVNFICTNAVPKAMTHEEIKQETKEGCKIASRYQSSRD